MEFKTQFLGEHSIWFHLAGLLFCLSGALLAKWHYWKKHQSQCEGTDCDHDDYTKFDFWFWFRMNGVEVLVSIVVSFCLVRFIDIIVHWAGIETLKIGVFSIPMTTDTVFYYLFFGVVTQYLMHKWYRKKKKN
jgi:hypothetical protein